MRHVMFLLIFTLYATFGGTALAYQCQQPIATMSVQELNYAEVNASPFEQRLFVYVPEIRAGGSGFQPFQLWIVEGVYGKPFLQANGSIDVAGFQQIRRSQNVRATPVSVVRGDGSDSGSFSIGGATYQVQVVNVSASKPSAVQLKICR